MIKKQSQNSIEDTSAAPTNFTKAEEKQVVPESRVGKELSDLTTRKVIILVLALMFSDPILSYTTYFNDNTSYEFGLDLLQDF